MTDPELARYIGRLQDAPNVAALGAIARELEALPPSRERDTLLRTVAVLQANAAGRN
jgi:hypothetical protein